METLFIYIAKSSGLIGLFYIAYYFLMRKETFFTANRWFLLAGLFTSVILPWIVFTTIVWVEPAPTDFDWSKLPMRPVQEESFEINWYLVLAIAYIIGIALLLAQFARDFYNLNRVLKGKTAHQQADHKFIDLKENIAPFSYFNTIVYNSSLYSEAEMESILEHEKVHSEQYHTIDVLITRFFCIVFWFNPCMWLYKKAILQNLEFIADSEAAKNISDKKAYQLTLLKITTHQNCVVLTNHFYQSLIKKRIVMLNKNQSKKWNLWKYAVVFPLLGAFLFFFQVKVVAQEKANPKQENETKSDSVDLAKFKIEKDLSPLSKGKKIIINGNVSSQEDLDKLDPNEIENIDVIKNTDNPTILVTTKHNTGKPTKSIKIIDNDIYINGAKVSQEDLDKIDPNEIASIDVIKNKEKQEIRIITKKKSRTGEEGEIYINGKKDTQTNINNDDPATKNDLIKKSIIIINGNFLPANVSIDDINPAKIESMSVYNSTQTAVKYGNVGGNDVIEIVTKKAQNVAPKTQDDVNKALLIINGKKADYKIKITNINEKLIKTMNIIKGENAVSKYGEDGKNGVIEITTDTPDKIIKK
nr:M56 family metallopeptidase [uncultured Flavobacterium sp.]